MSSTAQPQPLEYSTRPVVGAVTSHSHDGQLTVTLLRDRSRVTRGAALAAGAVVVFLAGLAIHMWQRAGGTGNRFVLVFMSLGAAAALFTAAKEVVAAFQPTVLRFDGRRLTYTRRGLFAVARIEWEKHWVVDLRVRRLRFRDTITRPFQLAIVLSSDLEYELLRGTRAEAGYAAAALRAALGLPPERWLETGYPPRLRWAQVGRTISVDGVTLAFHPPLPWLPILLALPLFVAGAALLAAYINPLQGSWWDPSTPNRWWGMLQVGVFTLFGMLLFGGVIYALRRTTVLAISDGRLIVTETGLRPGHAEWPLTDVREFRAAPARFGRANLYATFFDGRDIPLLRRKPRTHIQWALDNLNRSAGEWYAAEQRAAATSAAPEAAPTE